MKRQVITKMNKFNMFITAVFDQTTMAQEQKYLRFDSGECFGFWEVFWILGSVLDSGDCFGFWEVLWILGSFLDSGECLGFWGVFGILGSVLQCGNCFGF